MGGETMTNKAYRQHEGVSRSELNVILTKSPLHFKYEQEHPEEETTEYGQITSASFHLSLPMETSAFFMFGQERR